MKVLHGVKSGLLHTMLGLGLLLLPFLLSACSSGGSSGGGQLGAVMYGTFLDSPVEGLEYQTETLSGVTDINGTFEYREGESITFYFGGTVLGQTPVKPLLTPIDLVPGAIDETNPEVVNIVRFLLTLDEDGNPDNGITLSFEMEQIAAEFFIDFSVNPADFNLDTEMVDFLIELYISGTFPYDQVERILASAEEAIAHLRESIEAWDPDRDGYTVEHGDCKEGYPDINPGAEEICGDGIDQNCDGVDKECEVELITWYQDFDGDYVGDGEMIVAAEQPAEYYFPKWELESIDGDCDDGNADIHPYAKEICGDGIDQNCDGIDKECEIELIKWYQDYDLDYFGDGEKIVAAEQPAEYYFPEWELESVDGDCDDGNADIHPGAEEICGDGIDQNCDGVDKECEPELPGL